MIFVIACSLCLSTFAHAQAPIRIAVVGMVHVHVSNFFKSLPSHPEVQLVGVSEPDPAVRAKYIKSTKLPSGIFFTTEQEMLAATHPQAILVYTTAAGHRAAIEIAAPMHIVAMVEKPLSTTVEDAHAIQRVSEKFHVPVLTNFDTTWFASNIAIRSMIEAGSVGELRKLVMLDGNHGPANNPPEFLGWLTDPKLNGAGALFDFGSYGVNLAIWFMHGELPLTVTAVTLHLQPASYPKVDDDSTIVLTYPHVQVIVEGSWNWPFERRDVEVYGTKGYIGTASIPGSHNDQLRERLVGESVEHIETVPAMLTPRTNELNYLAAVVSGTLQPLNDQSSLNTNVAVIRVLDAARRSAAMGRTISLAGEMRIGK
jgi:predicted dehydrogenase